MANTRELKMNQRKIGWILATLLLTAACGFTHASAVTVKIATLSPEGSFWMKKMREGAEQITAQTEARVRFKFYPGGVMGDDKTVLRKIRIGQLHGGMVVGTSLSQYYPDSELYGLPLTFRSLEEVDFARSRIDPLLLAGFEKKGFVVFGLAEGGFAYIMSKNPVRTLAELRHQKLWVPVDSKVGLETVKAFGVSPIPLAMADVLAGLQTGLINTVASPPYAAIVLQWHTQVRYISEVPLIYTFGILAMDKRVFVKLKKQDQILTRKVFTDVFKVIEKNNRSQNVEALKAFQSQGAELITPPAAALAEWETKAATVADRLVQDDKLSKELVTLLFDRVKDYRAK
jgi:TRAP-type C4-dicarboxylate transport system substrate-binding protein